MRHMKRAQPVAISFEKLRQEKKTVAIAAIVLVAAIVVASQGKEIDFGSFLAKDIKAFLVAAIRDYYGEPASGAADFIG